MNSMCDGIIIAISTDPISELLSKLNSKYKLKYGFYLQGEHYLFNFYDNELLSWSIYESFISQITYYPINHPKFKSSVINILSNNINPDKSLIYHNLLLKLQSNNETGETIINTILTELNLTYENGITKNLSFATGSQREILIEHLKPEITKLIAIGINLFIHNSQFRSSLLGSTNNLMNSEFELIKYLNSEEENMEKMSELIYNLYQERVLLGNYQVLPVPSKNRKYPSPIVKTIINDYDSLRDLGQHLNNIITNSHKMADLTNIVCCYNNLIRNIDLPQIPIPDPNHKILIIGPYDTPEDYTGNLSELSGEQLMDILVYCESLNDNYKYISIQNEVIRELARRESE